MQHRDNLSTFTKLTTNSRDIKAAYCQIAQIYIYFLVTIIHIFKNDIDLFVTTRYNIQYILSRYAIVIFTFFTGVFLAALDGFVKERTV